MNFVETASRAILGLLGLFLFPYAIVCLVLTLRHRLPGIDAAWAIKTGLSPANFDDRGKALRQRGMRLLLAWVIVMVGLVMYARSHPAGR